MIGVLFDGFDLSDVLISALSGVFAVIVAWVALRGKNKEVTALHIQTLTEGQANRISALEDRLTEVENALYATRGDLRAAHRRVDRLRAGLLDSVEYLEDLLDWVDGGAVGRAPSGPSVRFLREIAEDG